MPDERYDYADSCRVIDRDKLVFFEKTKYNTRRCKMDYITLKEASQKWNVTPRQINYLCTSGRIPGAVKMATIWLIPKNAEKPVDRRRKENKSQ